jgi:uncharacterized protein YbjT (DUF2867 family)
MRIPIKVEQREMRNATTIVVAGATGNLGGRIVNSILREGAAVRALVRTGTARDKSEALRRCGASVVEVDFHELDQVVKACAGASCLVSFLARNTFFARKFEWAIEISWI